MRSLVPILLTFGLLIAVFRQDSKAQSIRSTKGPDVKSPAPTSSGTATTCPETKVTKIKPSPASEINNVTLTGGSTPCSGWVKLLLQNRSAVILGLTASSVAESDLVCQKLGCGRMLRMLPGPIISKRQAKVWEHRLDCWWNHTELQECMKVTKQEHLNDSLGVVCEGAHTFSRLGPKPDHCAGSLLVFHHRSELGVADGPTAAEANSLCQRLRCGWAVEIALALDRHPNVKVLGDLKCLLQQEYTQHCLDVEQISSGTPVYSITCREGTSPAFRLQDGGSQCDGLVEVYYNGSWWPVCQDAWGEKEQGVVCSQVGCQGRSESWNRPGSLGKNHTGSKSCVRCRQFAVLPETGGVRLWDIQMEQGSFQQLNVTCLQSPGSTGGTQVESGSSGLVTAGILLIVLLLLLLALAWGWNRYRGRGVEVFRRKRTQRQWIGPTGATSHTVSVHRNNNASSRPVSAVSASSHNYSVEPSRGLTAYPALESRSNMMRLGQDRSSDSDYDFFEPNIHPL